MNKMTKMSIMVLVGLSIGAIAGENAKDHKLFFSSDNEEQIENRVQLNRRKLEHMKSMKQKTTDKCPMAKSTANDSIFNHNHSKEYVYRKVEVNRRKMDSLIKRRKLILERHLAQKKAVVAE